LDFIDADGIFEHHPVWPLKIKEAGSRRRMATWTKDDRYTLSRQMVVRAQHIVIAADLMVDVVNAGTAARRQCHRMMNRIDADQSDIADSVAHTRVADLGPEPLVARGIGGVKADMTEAGDAGVACREGSFAPSLRADRPPALVSG